MQFFNNMMHMQMYIPPERFFPKLENGEPAENPCFYDGQGEPGNSRRCARDASSAPSRAFAPPTAPVMALHTLPHSLIKAECLSPNERSRSPSVTPSSSSFPGASPDRGSPHGTPHASNPPTQPPRNYSDIMRTLAARYNNPNPNEFLKNGFGTILRHTQMRPQLGKKGIFQSLAVRQHGVAQRVQTFPPILDMHAAKSLAVMSRMGRPDRHARRRKRVTSASNVLEHSPLDLSAATEQAAKRARLSISPRSDSNEDERESQECTCAEARARVSAWTVDDVCDFINSIDICAEYSSNFREQSIDGAGLPLLTEDHLTGLLQMKLGPALKLQATLSKRLEPCQICQSNNFTSGLSKMNGNSSLKSEPRSSTTSPS